ncbi:hypothetical protein MgSA37_00971 [Mucilaginibacter gotjawali]|uniref:Uncharacterized protein n=2 Tax=Mucilaginibacter gotjawali TaxID=1550579 RepID=A0A120MYB8_9SPHI|nr:hypothetical protein [Mucilaginibacter gotjawali]BAU52808.1 hypothetical protein MgSA37_00971 [Mucilaginibacter gotjawali]
MKGWENSIGHYHFDRLLSKCKWLAFRFAEFSGFRQISLEPDS